MAEQPEIQLVSAGSVERGEADGILKAAMVNAVTRIEKGAGRKERSDLRRFILECAKILVIYPQDILNND